MNIHKSACQAIRGPGRQRPPTKEVRKRPRPLSLADAQRENALLRSEFAVLEKKTPGRSTFSHRGPALPVVGVRWLAHFRDGFAQRRPFIFQPLVFNLPQLGLGDVKFLAHDLARARHIGDDVLGQNQGVEYLLSLLQGQALRRHGALLQPSWVVPTFRRPENPAPRLPYRPDERSPPGGRSPPGFLAGHALCWDRKTEW